MNNQNINEENSIIEIKSLTKFYGKFKALDQVDLSFPKGKIIGLLGPNGSGKTTLIKIITGLLKQYQGEILIDGKQIGIDTKKIVSYLPDRNCLPDNWTVEKALTYFKTFFPDFEYDKAKNLISQLGIDLSKKFKEFSKGTKEKLQLSLVLSRNAKIYVFDEPIAGVDPAARDLIFNLILNNYHRNSTIIICTHLISEVEEILDYAIFLNRGKVYLREYVDKIKESSGKSLNEVFKEVYRCAPIN